MTYRNESLGTINKVICIKMAPLMCSLYSEKKDALDDDIFVSRKYFSDYLSKLFGSKGENFAKLIKFEWVHVRGFENLKIALLTLPHENMIGQSECVGYIVDPNKYVAASYCMEVSCDNKYAVCEWHDKTHFNYGIVDSKLSFVRQICELHKDTIEDFAKPNFDELDLKHRLAREIGVRVENLDFYMQKFQNKVVMEMQGIDTSGIDSDIENQEEWLRYCKWEIEQAKKRLTPEELNASYKMFQEYINHHEPQ